MIVMQNKYKKKHGDKSRISPQYDVHGELIGKIGVYHGELKTTGKYKRKALQRFFPLYRAFPLSGGHTGTF